MFDFKQVYRGEVFSLKDRDIQRVHQPRSSHGKIVADHDNGLQSPPVTLPQSLHQFRFWFSSMHKQPLFELVDDDNDLFQVVLTTSQ